MKRHEYFINKTPSNFARREGVIINSQRSINVNSLQPTQTRSKRMQWRNGRTRQGSSRQNAKTFKAISKQEDERKQQVKAEIERLKLEMPANAIGVLCKSTNRFNQEVTEVMTWGGFCKFSYVVKDLQFIAWQVEGIVGGKPSKERQYCEQVINNILEDDALFDAMTADETEHEMFAWGQLSYCPYISRETLGEVM